VGKPTLYLLWKFLKGRKATLEKLYLQLNLKRISEKKYIIEHGRQGIPTEMDNQSAPETTVLARAMFQGRAIWTSIEKTMSEFLDTIKEPAKKPTFLEAMAGLFKYFRRNRRNGEDF
jgi:hypothetical protein